MNPTALTQRTRYLPTYEVDFVRFTPCAVLAIAGSIGAAYLSHLVRQVGLNFPLLIAAVIALPPTGLVLAAVIHGRCRHPVTAAGLGILAGSITYLGSFQWDLVDQLGMDYVHRVDLLPGYVERYVETEVIVVVDKSSTRPTREPTRYRLEKAYNWFFFWAELGITLLFSAGMAWSRSQKPYCEKCGAWLRGHCRLTFPPGTTQTIVKGLESGSLAELARMPGYPTIESHPHTNLEINFCERLEGKPATCPVFLSVQEVGLGSFMRATIFSPGVGGTAAKYLELTNAEVQDLAHRIPELASTLQLGAEITHLTAVGTGKMENRMDEKATGSVQAEPVPEPFAGRMLTSQNIKKVGTVAQGDGFIMGGGIIAALIGSCLAALGADSRDWWRFLAMPGWLFLVSGAVTALVSGYSTWFYLGRRGNRFWCELAKKEFSRRPNRWVDPSQPETYFVAIAPPRERWTDLVMEDASDLGFLHFDSDKAQLLFEGDRFRYRIPAGAIRDCSLEYVTITIGNSKAGLQNKFTAYFIVIRAVNDAQPDWELCLTDRSPEGKGTEKHRRLRSVELAQRINDFVRAHSSRLITS